MTLRNKQIEYYKEILKENEFLLLKSKDGFFKNHYIKSPLNVLTNFSGTEGEAIIDCRGKIRLFVDTRYHILVDKQAFSDIEVYKMDFSEWFFGAFQKFYKKNSILYVYDDISLYEYMELDKYFDLRRYSLKKEFLKNDDFNKKAQIFVSSSDTKDYGFNYKIEKLKTLYPKISKMLIFNLDEIAYLTGLRSFQTKYSSLLRSILYLDLKNSSYTLFSDKIPKIKTENLKYNKLKYFKDFINSIDDEIYFDINSITLDNFLAVKKPREIKQNKLPLITSIKPKSVISHLLNANKKLDIAIYNFKKKLKKGLNEVELVEIFEDELLKAGAKCPSFKTILALGENSASIHYSTYDKNKILNDEMLLLLDCGGYYEEGYATDITRTFYFGKNPPKIYKTIYTAVLKAFFAVYLSNETDAKKLHILANDYLKEYNNDGFFFNHGLGHGIGTSCHQNPPRLSLTSLDIIKPYQTHSIEPGLYGKSKSTNLEFGVRLENCVYSDLDYKKRTLSKFPFEDILIDYSMLNQKEKNALVEWQNKAELNECI